MRNTDFTQYLTIHPTDLRRLQWKNGWALSFIGLVVYCVLRLLGQKPKDYKGICPYFEIGNHWGGLEMGWFFICCKNCDDSLKRHEVGHGIQNAAVGGLTMIVYCIGSALRYWKRRILGAKTPYDSWYFEGDATRLGTEYVENIEKTRSK